MTSHQLNNTALNSTVINVLELEVMHVIYMFTTEFVLWLLLLFIAAVHVLLYFVTTSVPLQMCVIMLAYHPSVWRTGENNCSWVS